jgi:hypothetical protein
MRVFNTLCCIPNQPMWLKWGLQIADVCVSLHVEEVYTSLPFSLQHACPLDGADVGCSAAWVDGPSASQCAWPLAPTGYGHVDVHVQSVWIYLHPPPPYDAMYVQTVRLARPTQSQDSVNASLYRPRHPYYTQYV